MFIVLDCGHSKKTAGKFSPDRTFFEYEWNRILGRRIGEKLTQMGISWCFTYDPGHSRHWDWRRLPRMPLPSAPPQPGSWLWPRIPSRRCTSCGCRPLFRSDPRQRRRCPCPFHPWAHGQFSWLSLLWYSTTLSDSTFLFSVENPYLFIRYSRSLR